MGKIFNMLMKYDTEIKWCGIGAWHILSSEWKPRSKESEYTKSKTIYFLLYLNSGVWFT